MKRVDKSKVVRNFVLLKIAEAILLVVVLIISYNLGLQLFIADDITVYNWSDGLLQFLFSLFLVTFVGVLSLAMICVLIGLVGWGIWLLFECLIELNWKWAKALERKSRK